jgi:hypothetical protein
MAPRQHRVIASLARGSLVGDLLLLRGNRAAADDDRPSHALPHRLPRTVRWRIAISSLISPRFSPFF